MPQRTGRPSRIWLANRPTKVTPRRAPHGGQSATSTVADSPPAYESSSPMCGARPLNRRYSVGDNPTLAPNRLVKAPTLVYPTRWLISATVIDVVTSRRFASSIRIADRKCRGEMPVTRRKVLAKWNLLKFTVLARSSTVTGSLSRSCMLRMARSTTSFKATPFAWSRHRLHNDANGAVRAWEDSCQHADPTRSSRVARPVRVALQGRSASGVPADPRTGCRYSVGDVVELRQQTCPQFVVIFVKFPQQWDTHVGVRVVLD